MSRSEKGITLVALIITIIILVILAAVSITAVTQTGLLNTATNGVGNYANAQVEERTAMDSYAHFTESSVQSLNARLNSTPVSSNP